MPHAYDSDGLSGEVFDQVNKFQTGENKNRLFFQLWQASSSQLPRFKPKSSAASNIYAHYNYYDSSEFNSPFPLPNRHHRFKPKLNQLSNRSNDKAYFYPFSNKNQENQRQLAYLSHRNEKASKIVDVLDTIRYNGLSESAHKTRSPRPNKFSRHPPPSQLQPQSPPSPPPPPLLPHTPSYYFFLTSTTTTTTPIHSYISHGGSGFNNKNEMYSLFVSMFTAALFLLFIMWRWTRIKKDMRKALREQAVLNRYQENSNNNSIASNTWPTSSSLINYNTSSSHVSSLPPPPPLNTSSSCYNANLIAQHTENLRALIGQLSNGQPRTPEQHQQIISAAKYCLQQLKQQTGLDSQQTISQYYNCNRHGRLSNNNANHSNINNRQSSSVNESPMHNPIASQVYNLLEDRQSPPNTVRNSRDGSAINPIELPPAYDSLMTKSSSLPSYHHMTDECNRN